MRIDKAVAERYPELSRSKVAKMLKDGRILVNGKRAKPSAELSDFDKIEVLKRENETVKKSTESFELEILYENENFMVVVKPAGLIVHPVETGEVDGTVVGLLMQKISVNQFEDRWRAGIVHRLDKDTSGLMIVVKTVEARDLFVEKFKNGQINKTYKVLVFGKLSHREGIIEAPIERALSDRKKMRVSASRSARNAITKYKLLREYRIFGQVFSLLEVKIMTGRTHQIRVHFSSIGLPVVGDEKYGNKKVNRSFMDKFGLKRQFLHAWKLSFIDPYNSEKLSFEAGLPDDLETLLEEISL